uniref:Uncharacterized protein n=1 Tax=uncultured marine group II/III euryarchaeote KM3_31_G10 TaxID=1456433 RepID=A0A075H434_9EURY|nr:hypothetical protein [uncultured marine group II/III euryarchaeote KM3_31_G10]
MIQAVEQQIMENESEERRASILRHAYGGRTPPAMPERQLVNQLTPATSINRLELLVLRRYPRRMVKSSNYEGPVAAACGRDETGVVGLVLWGEEVDQVRTGDVVRVLNGWCRRNHGELVVSSGRSGTLEVLPC